MIERFEETDDGKYEMRSTDVATKSCNYDDFARPTNDAIPIVRSYF